MAGARLHLEGLRADEEAALRVFAMNFKGKDAFFAAFRKYLVLSGGSPC